MQIPESPRIRKLSTISEMTNQHTLLDHFNIQRQNIHLSYIIFKKYNTPEPCILHFVNIFKL